MTCSDMALLAEFRRQVENMGRDLALMLWQGRKGVHDVDLIRVADEVDAQRAGAAKALPR